MYCITSTAIQQQLIDSCLLLPLKTYCTYSFQLTRIIGVDVTEIMFCKISTRRSLLVYYV